ncbi:MAG: 2-oxoacid:acceptor oxidoreductase subunit alpha [Gammaproteobacteria bacterium]|nr:2-oxoacid:acceptor oxidoreductase subunit alpha [Gammaproteobacteria bacterium]
MPINDQIHYWRIGGPQGTGIDTSAHLFARACLFSGLSVLGRREYHSNIKGRHSYFDIAAGTAPPLSVAERVDLLVAYEAETLFRHLPSVRSGGVVLFDQESTGVTLQQSPYLDPSVRERLARWAGATASVDELLALVSAEGVRCYPVSYKRIMQAIADELRVKVKQVERIRNTVGVALSALLFGLDKGGLCRAVEQLFCASREHVTLNLLAVEHASNYLLQQEWSVGQAPQSRLREQALLLNASQSVALGKLAGGLGLQSYYPISPATDESTFLEAHSTVSRHDGLTLQPQVVQVEDEIAAITMASGAALTGVRAATATSGPGLSLMTEGLGWAGMNEVPLVITHYQRGGPSTGMPTRTEQGDLQFAIHGGHGEFPRMVIASGSVEQAFYDAMHAFNYAERYQLPVIHLLDKHLTSRYETITDLDSAAVVIDRGERCEANVAGERLHPFRLVEDGISPRALLGVPGCQHWQTGVEHDEYGLVSEDPQMRERMMEKRAARLAAIPRELPLEAQIRCDGDEDAPLLLIGWGSTRGALLDAAARLRWEGQQVRVMMVRLLWPFPAAALAAEWQRATTRVVVEENFSGQFAALLREQTGLQCDHLIVKYSGRPVCGDALVDALFSILDGRGEPRLVLRNPWE